MPFNKSGYVKSSHTKFQTTSDKSDDVSFKAIFKKSDYVAPYSTFLNLRAEVDRSDYLSSNHTELSLIFDRSN